MTFRSPASLRDGSPPELSFGTWADFDALPEFDDDVTGFGLRVPSGSIVPEPQKLRELPVYFPDNPAFPPSAVPIPIPASAAIHSLSDDAGVSLSQQSGSSVGNEAGGVGASSTPGETVPDPLERGQFSDPGRSNDPHGGNLGTRSRVRLGITITFPDGERSDQRYSAHPG